VRRGPGQQDANAPRLVIVGREAVASWMSVAAFQRAPGPKELVWIEDSMHNDLYDKPEYVGPAVQKLTEFFTKNLDPAAAPAEVVSA
jgi:hypothetical protein